jgi:hypothetical protein
VHSIPEIRAALKSRWSGSELASLSQQGNFLS